MTIRILHTCILNLYILITHCIFDNTCFYSFPLIIQAINGDKIKICFVHVCKHIPTLVLNETMQETIHLPLHILGNKVSTDDGKPCFRVRIRCDDMELAADLVQDMAKFFKIIELEAEADFPEELARFEEVLAQVEDLNSARIRLAADMADDSQKLKALVVRAEDSRIMCDMESMRRAYTELYSLDNQLIVGYNIREANHTALLALLKEVNQMIQKAANLRIGKSKTSIINDCRIAVKSNNFPVLARIIKFGSDYGSR